MRLAVGLGVLLLALLLVRTLAQSHVRRTATNDLPPVAELAVAAGATSCQTEGIVPGGTGNVTFPVRAAGPGPARVRVTVDGSTGTITAQPAVTYAFLRFSHPLRADVRGAPVCFKNESTAPIALLGAPPPDGSPVRVRLDWFRPSPQRNWTMGSTIAARVSLLKAPLIGPWAFWVAALAVLALSLAAILWTLRGVDE